MEHVDEKAIRELLVIMRDRGADFDTSLNISLLVRRVTQKMVDWLHENPNATSKEVTQKAKELNKIR